MRFGTSREFCEAGHARRPLLHPAQAVQEGHKGCDNCREDKGTAYIVDIHAFLKLYLCKRCIVQLREGTQSLAEAARHEQ